MQGPEERVTELREAGGVGLACEQLDVLPQPVGPVLAALEGERRGKAALQVCAAVQLALRRGLHAHACVRLSHCEVWAHRAVWLR